MKKGSSKKYDEMECDSEDHDDDPGAKKRRKQEDEDVREGKGGEIDKKVDTSKKRHKRVIIDSDSASDDSASDDSASDDSDVRKPWIKDTNTYQKKELNVKRKFGKAIGFDAADEKSIKAPTPLSAIPRKRKLPNGQSNEELSSAIEKKIKASTASLNTRIKKKILLSSDGADEKKSNSSIAPVDIPKKKKTFNSPSNQECILVSSASDTKIVRKEPKQVLKSVPVIAKTPKVTEIDKPSPSKFPSKPSINVSNTAGTEDNQTQPNWRSSEGGKDGNASRSKLTPQWQRHLHPTNSQQQKEQPQHMQQYLPGNLSSQQKIVRLRESILREKILKNLNKIIDEVFFDQKGNDLVVGKVEQLQSLGPSGSNIKYTNDEESYDFFERNDDGSIIIDPPNKTAFCGDSKVEQKDWSLRCWGILPPPDSILSMHNNDLHASSGDKYRKRRSGGNIDGNFPRDQEYHQGHGNEPPSNKPQHAQEYWGGREREGQRFIDGGKRDRRDNGPRRDWGNDRGNELAVGAGRAGSRRGGVGEDRHLNAPSFDRGPPTRQNKRD